MLCLLRSGSAQTVHQTAVMDVISYTFFKANGSKLILFLIILKTGSQTHWFIEKPFYFWFRGWAVERGWEQCPSLLQPHSASRLQTHACDCTDAAQREGPSQCQQTPYHTGTHCCTGLHEFGFSNILVLRLKRRAVVSCLKRITFTHFFCSFLLANTDMDGKKYYHTGDEFLKPTNQMRHLIYLPWVVSI